MIIKDQANCKFESCPWSKDRGGGSGRRTWIAERHFVSLFVVKVFRGYGSIGTAPALQADICRFESDYLHQKQRVPRKRKECWQSLALETPTKYAAHVNWRMIQSGTETASKADRPRKGFGFDSYFLRQWLHEWLSGDESEESWRYYQNPKVEIHCHPCVKIWQPIDWWLSQAACRRFESYFPRNRM